MKKWFALILAVMMVLGLCACNVDTPDETKGSTPAATTTVTPTTTVAPTTTVPPTTLPSVEGVFSAGYGKTDITPEEFPVPMYSAPVGTTTTSGILSRIYATCLAITDADGSTVLLYSLDLQFYRPEIMDPMVESISKATGIPVDKIYISCTHSHASPGYTRTEYDVIKKYNQLLEQRLVEAAVAALADRRQAEMFGATVETRRMNYCKRIGCLDPECCEGGGLRESKPDGALQLIKFVREGGKEIILTNFQGHPNSSWGAGIGSDVVGLYRDALTAQKDCEVIYFTGASGNLDTVDFEQTVTYVRWGEKLAEYALSAEDLYQPIATGKVQVKPVEYEAQVRPDGEDKELEALVEQYKAGQIDRNALVDAFKARDIKMTTVYPFSAIIHRIELGATNDIEICAISFGDAGFVVAPYEMFDTNGMFIKENSPFDMTIIATCATGSYHRYMPSEIAWRHGGYEVDCAIYVEGTAEALADQYVSMLTELYQSR